MSNPSDPRRPAPKSTPEIEPPPGSPPKKFPAEPAPLDRAVTQQAAGTEANGASGDRLGSGEDPSVEAGVDANDPEQTAATDDGDDVQKSYD